MRSVLAICVVLASVYCVFASNTAYLTLLTDAVPGGSMCIDGTPAGYYFVAGTGDGVNKWIVYHEGGGWCVSYQDCYYRSLTDLGSSKNYPPVGNLGGGYFDANPVINPLMYNWNMVYMKYCDGGSFSGNATAPFKIGNTDVTLHFRGTAIRTAMRDHLLARGLSKATDVVVSGCSAGGLATFLHADWWRAAVPSAHVVGLPDSGFFIDYESPQKRYESQMTWVYSAMNVAEGIDADCVKFYKGSAFPWKCMFAQYVAPFIKTPIFALQSQYDAWQIPEILASNNATLINIYGKNLTDILTKSLIMSPTKTNGVFLDSCYHHCGAWGIHIDGKNQAEAFTEFYTSPSASKAWYQKGSFPCGTCCAVADSDANGDDVIQSIDF
eukprot:TRINITY_DN3051_c0_g1_i1.p1 TRINITY_DN3051_c0_g1~~TRINITY_DN3051_c0_g1_i1.p1  ORF type:complete len:391 (+),score=62.63 TRINITY_DN3051_c0_g1_i1:29-1174(+)